MNKLIIHLNQVIEFVAGSKTCAFYRNFWQNNIPTTPISTFDDWKKIPILERSDLIKVPIWDRIYVERNKIESIRMSSGTSGNEVLFSAKMGVNKYEHISRNWSRPEGLLLFLPQPHRMHQTIRSAGLDIPVIAGDYANVELSVKIALRAGVDTVVCLGFIMEQLIDTLQQEKALKQIKTIMYSGQLLTATHLSQLQSCLPYTNIYVGYYSGELPTEVGASLSIESPLEIQPTPPHYWEVLGDNGQIVDQLGDEGVLIVTTLSAHERSFPYIRYNTGDRVRIISHHEDKLLNTFELLGRDKIDTLKFYGGILSVFELDRVIAKLLPRALHEYQFIFQHAATPKITLELPQSYQNADYKKLSIEIANTIRVSPDTSLQDLITQKKLQQFEITFKEKNNVGGKHRRIIELW